MRFVSVSEIVRIRLEKNSNTSPGGGGFLDITSQAASDTYWHAFEPCWPRNKEYRYFRSFTIYRNVHENQSNAQHTGKPDSLTR
jgi:hypothetical protein